MNINEGLSVRLEQASKLCEAGVRHAKAGRVNDSLATLQKALDVYWEASRLLFSRFLDLLNSSSQDAAITADAISECWSLLIDSDGSSPSPLLGLAITAHKLHTVCSIFSQSEPIPFKFPSSAELKQIVTENKARHGGDPGHGVRSVKGAILALGRAWNDYLGATRENNQARSLVNAFGQLSEAARF